MKTKAASLNSMVLCYAFLSFAVLIPNEKMNIINWITSLAFNTAIYTVYSLFLIKNSTLKPLASLIILIYLIYILSARIRTIYQYLKLYHGNNSAAHILFITLLFILIIVADKNLQIYKMAPIFVCAIILFAAILLIINFKNINAYNLYFHKKSEIIEINNVTLFDYIIPMAVIANSIEGYKKYQAIYTVNLISYVLIILIFISFSVFKGDLLYSLSPLQCIIQVSQTNLINNYDAMFNFLICFIYFGSILLILWAYKVLKEKFTYWKYGDLLLTVPLLILSPVISVPVVVLEFIAVITCIIGREKV